MSAGRGSDQAGVRLDPGADPLNVRFTAGLRDRLKAAASANHRSMNSEICARLEGSFETQAAGNVEASTLHPDIAWLIDRHVEARVKERLQEVAASLSGGK